MLCNFRSDESRMATGRNALRGVGESQIFIEGIIMKTKLRHDMVEGVTELLQIARENAEREKSGIKQVDAVLVYDPDDDEYFVWNNASGKTHLIEFCHVDSIDNWQNSAETITYDWSDEQIYRFLNDGFDVHPHKDN
jgi:hypothetical protein